MGFSYQDFLLGRTKFCCCIPVRVGVISMAVLGIVFSAVLSVALWYELSVQPNIAGGVQAAFVIGGLVETFLFAASIFGLVGSVVRKLSFVRIYAIITYVHFILNLVVAIWFLVVVSKVAGNADQALCNDSGAEQQCMKLIGFGLTTLFVIASLVLLIEIYGALVVTRYVNQLSSEKFNNRQTRRGLEEAFRLEAARVRYSTLASSHELTPLGAAGVYDDHDGTEYDPYREADAPPPIAPVHMPRRFRTFMDKGRPSPSVEVGYGGGTWTYEEISEEAKARLRRREEELECDVETPTLTDEAEAARQRSEMKVVGGPTTPHIPQVEELPCYPYPSVEATESHL